MEKHTLFRRVSAAALAATLGCGLALATAGSASADDANVSTPGWHWEYVDDRLIIAELTADLGDDYLGSGVSMLGWTGDAFDDFAYQLNIGNGTTTNSVELTPVSFNPVDNGLSTIISTGATDFGDGFIVVVTATKQIQGSFARWSIHVDSVGTGDPDLVELSIAGNLGSDGNTDYTLVGSSSLVSTDGGAASDPVLGWQLEGVGGTSAFLANDGIDILTAQTFGASELVLTMAAQDYERCARDEAVADMTALAPSIAASFGGNVARATLDDCIVLPSPADIEPGSEVATEIAMTTGSSEFDYKEYIGSETEIGVIVSGLPAGLSLDVVAADSGAFNKLFLSGSTTQTGTFPVSVTIFQPSGEGAGLRPVTTTLTLRVVAVAAPVVPTPEPSAAAPELAATGTESTSGLAIAGGLLGAGIVALVIARRRNAVKDSI